MSRVRSAEGFTLFEVIVAVMILGISLPMLFQLFSGTLRAAKQSKDYTQAMQFAQQKLEELTVMKGAPPELESGEGPDGLFWERLVVPMDPLVEEPPLAEEIEENSLEDDTDDTVVTPLTPLYEVTVSVRWDADPAAPSTSLHTLLVFAPLPAPPSDEELDAVIDPTAP